MLSSLVNIKQVFEPTADGTLATVSITLKSATLYRANLLAANLSYSDLEDVNL